jgi:uridine monophosphate synthetase
VCRLRYEERAPLAQNPLGARLFELMARKRTNLSVAADVSTADDMLALADAVGPHVAVLKTHVDVFDTWTEEHARKLLELADKHGEF